jgi:hypothetical protein
LRITGEKGVLSSGTSRGVENAFSAALSTLRNVQSAALQSLILVNDVDATVNLNQWASNDDLSFLILIIVVGNALISVAAAAILLGLAGRQTAIFPAGFLAATPSRRPPVAVTIGPVFVPVAVFPAPIIIVIGMLVSVVVLAILVPVVCHHRWRAQA